MTNVQPDGEVQQVQAQGIEVAVHFPDHTEAGVKVRAVPRIGETFIWDGGGKHHGKWKVVNIEHLVRPDSLSAIGILVNRGAWES